MRIGGSGRVTTTGVRGAGGRQAAPGFKVEGQGAAGAAKGPQATAGVASVDALLALQGAEDATTGRRRAVKRASRLLDVLDEIKLALLAGNVPASKLRALVSAVESQRHAVADPELQHVLDEVELRARVEAAKYESYL